MSAALPADRYQAFQEAIDDIRRRAQAKVGDDDVRRVKRLMLLSRSAEVMGRVLIHFSIGPVGFLAGVGALWLHKTLQATEIGHPALHGCYDGLEGAEAFHSKRFSWDTPIDEESWREVHNLRHHPYTNVSERDPDMQFGPVRLTAETPWKWYHRFQLPYTLFTMWPAFTSGINLQFTGFADLLSPNTPPHILPDRSKASKRRAVRRLLRSFVPYYAKEYVLFPLLAGPMFWKVLLGNWMAETLRDLWAAACIFCGHLGDDVVAHPAGTKAGSRGRWYAMQCESTHNFSCPAPIDVLCGGLDLQIEHHLFPKLPPQRLREIAPEVRAACEAHGVPYRTAPWSEVLWQSLRHLHALSKPDAQPAMLG